MEFLVAFALDIPVRTPKSEISDRENAEAAATAKLAGEGHLVRVWRSSAQGETTIVGLYRADSGAVRPPNPRSVAPGPADVLARLGRGEEVDASRYPFRTATQIETAAPNLDWLNKGVFVSVGGRRSGGVTYETYLVA